MDKRSNRTLTLAQHLVRQRGRTMHGDDALDALIVELSEACRAIARKLVKGTLEMGESIGPPQELGNIHGPPLVSARGPYRLMFQALDRPLDLDIDVALGSIFSVVAPFGDTLPSGSRQVCAGYAIYGPCAMLVLTLGNGTHAYTLDPVRGRWLLSHPFMRVPDRTLEFAVDASNSHHWEPAVKRYVDECLAGLTGPRHCRFSMRWTGSIVSDTHRVLMRGGAVLFPRDMRDQGACARFGRPRLVHEANPIAFLIEQAGGRATTGSGRPADVRPDSLEQRIGFIFGSSEEVVRIERYSHEEPLDVFVSPLFGQRGLFAHHDAGHDA